MARPRLVAGFIILALACNLVLTDCSSQDAAPLAHQACAQVERALAAERQVASASAPRAAHLEAAALDDVRAALPLAALAAGDDTSWQALDATLSESNRVPLRYLLHALSDQCANSAGDG